ncbi:ef hand family protein [Stylonychia lemnae]|uniref:Ef hand family protein n=1 Tax=Stylonychia lemnae TaxID=5949 RepID=A0A077ZPL9_STYLE|nr:ef hand family protein [Stylonychia lemnae]|eukprot:CDW71315.1 ef hand family protein [Stylonychia lemnae]
MVDSKTPQQILYIVKESLNARGASTIRSLGRAFRSIDSYNGDRKIDKEEFYVGLKEYGADISKKEAEVLLDYLDTDKDGFVNYDEFLVGIRGKPNAKRQTFIDKAYFKFDKDGDGRITAADLRGVYDCSSHPKVQSGEMCEEEVYVKFLQNFGDKNRDGTISRDEWNDYYAAVSSSIDNDDHFITLMITAWRL